ncbi:MAG: glycosyl transferase family 1 [Gammaproteobacteria bacterium]|nr:MAG: glycosyl transferase family 1 [Gammaproteobacteria bacterium]
MGEVWWLERNPGRHDGLAGLWRLARELRARRYDRAWLLHDSPRYALALWLAGVPVTRGYGQGPSRLLLSEPMELPGGTGGRHPIELAGALLEAYGVPATEEEPVLPVSPEADARIGRRFGSLPRPWLALGLGSSEPRKQWGAERFAALAARLAREGPWQLLLLGASPERPLAEAVLAAAPGRAHDALDLPIDDTAALLARCRGYVGNDTGFLNMAAALGVPSIGLFGGSPPLTHSRRIRVIRPARGEGMAGIGVEQVAEAVARLGETGDAD